MTRPTKKPAQHILDHYRRQLQCYAMTREEVAKALGCHVATTVRWIPIDRPGGWPKGRARAERSQAEKPAPILSPRKQAEAEKRARLAAELAHISCVAR